MCLVFEWLWVIIIVGYPLLIASKPLWTPVATPETHVVAPIEHAPTAFDIGFVIITTVVMLGLAVYGFIMLPKTLGKGTAKITHRTADLLVPAVTRHAPLSPKKRRQVSFRLVLYLKLGAALLGPLLVILFARDAPLTKDLSLITASLLAIAALVSVSCQYTCARLLRVPHKQIW